MADNIKAYCGKRYAGCKANARSRYENSARECEGGDWSKVVALNRLAGKNLTERDLTNNCKQEVRETRDQHLKDCDGYYTECLADN